MRVMKVLGVIGLVVALAIGGVIAWWKINYPTYTYRCRMNVEVLVDGAVRSGASVIEVRIDKQPKFGSAPPQVSHVYGEAVFVDLGGGRNVVALLPSEFVGRPIMSRPSGYCFVVAANGLFQQQRKLRHKLISPLARHA